MDSNLGGGDGIRSAVVGKAGGQMRQSVLSKWLKIQRDDKMFGDCCARNAGGDAGVPSLRGIQRNSGRKLESKRRRTGGNQQRSSDAVSRLKCGTAVGRTAGLGGEAVTDTPIRRVGAGDGSLQHRVQIYEKLRALVADPMLPELTLAEAKEYVLKLRAEGARAGEFFPSDMVIAARSLKLTRRLFHVGGSVICAGGGLWLNKGVRVERGEFVGFYVGWLYTESQSASVWDQQYLDNTYTLGLPSIPEIDGSEVLRVHARDDGFCGQEQIFTLGFANEWIWEDGSRGGNLLKFGRDGMVFAQRTIQSSKSRVEVTIGFGNEGTPFGGWASYTLALARRLGLLVQMVWLQVQFGLREDTRTLIREQCNDMMIQLEGVTFRDIPTLRGCRSNVATLIAGVELQDTSEDWGGVGFDEALGFGDNLRRLVLHPEVRRKCTFRQADRPGRADTRGIGDIGDWERIIQREGKLRSGIRRSNRPQRMVEGMERIDGVWSWSLPLPLRREDMLESLASTLGDSASSVSVTRAVTIGDEVPIEDGLQEGRGSKWQEQCVALRLDDDGVSELGEMDICAPGAVTQVTGSKMAGGGTRWDEVVQAEGGGDNLVNFEESEVAQLGKIIGGWDQVGEAMRVVSEVVPVMSGCAGVKDKELVLLEGMDDDRIEMNVGKGSLSSGTADRIALISSEVRVGTRWIYDSEECEVCRVISDSEVEVIFADKRVIKVSGPFLYPDEDDFLGWPSRRGYQKHEDIKLEGLAPITQRTGHGNDIESLGIYHEDLDVLGFSGGVRELIDQVGMKIVAPAENTIRLATWNASGLIKLSKVRYVIALMALAQIDIVCIQDTRLEPGQWKDELETEMRKLMGPGSSVFVATVASRVRGSRGPNVGGQIFLKSSRIRSSCRFGMDDSALGLVCWMDFQVGSHDVRIVSVYVPPAHGEKVEGLYCTTMGTEVDMGGDKIDLEYRGALALRTCQYVRRSEKWEGCIDYILGVAQKQIDQHLRASNGVVFCVGDFNASATVSEARSVNGTIGEWTEFVGLENCMGFRQLSSPLTFFRGSEGVSAIDHVLFSVREGITPVKHWVLDDSLWLSLSNHCPLVVDFAMPGMTNAYVSRRGRKMVTRRERLDICRARCGAEEGEMSRDIVDYQRYIQVRLKQERETGSLDEQLELVLRVTKAALRAVQRLRRKADWWSPIIVAITANLIAVQEIERYAFGHGRCRWESPLDWSKGLAKIVGNWRRQVSRVGPYKGSDVQIDLLMVSGNGPEYWLEFDKVPMEDRGAMLKLELRRLKYLLRQQERLELRLRRQQIANKRMGWRQRGLHLRELREIMGGRSVHFSMEYLVDSGLYMIDERQIHHQVSAHFRQWFTRKDRDWGFLAMDSDFVRLWSDKSYFMSQHAPSCIPQQLLEVVWTAMRPKTASIEAQSLFVRSILEAPTLEEFERELAATSPHSAGGPTGVTYNAMMGWPDEVFKRVHSILVEFWEDKRVPQCWKWRWLVPIPKTPDNITLEDLRPLMLTDVVRKVWVSVLVHKIQAHLESCGLLAAAQHGTLSSRGTEGALVQFRNILEEARESCTNVYLSSWDVVKAFDRLQKNVQIMCWVRLGIPMEIAEYLVLMDTGGITMVRTPFAERILERSGIAGFSTSEDPKKTAAFSPTSGTGQGNIDSPLVWTAFMDILLDSLATVEESQFYIRSSDFDGEGLSVVQEIAYVDDLVSLTSRLEGLQRKAEVVCAFFSIFGMDSARIKFRTFQVEWGSEYTTLGDNGVPCKSQSSSREYILVRKDGWKARKVWIQTHRVAKPFKYLGVLFDLSNRDMASFERSVAIARKGIAQVCQSLGDFELRIEALLFCVYPKLLYSAKFASWPLRLYLDIDRIFSSAYRRILGLRKGFPEELLYAPWGFRGLGIARFSDEVQMAKLATLSRGSTADKHTRDATLGLILRGFRQQNMKPMYTQMATLGQDFISPQPLFIRSVVEWLSEGEMLLRKGGVEVIDQSHTLLTEYCKRHSLPLTVEECAKLEAYGIASLGDVVMLSEFEDDTVVRRGRSRTRAMEGRQRRGMEGMCVTSDSGDYEVLRYVHPQFVIKRSSDRIEVIHHDQVSADISAMPTPPKEAVAFWISLPQELHFLYAKLPSRAPDLSTVLLARDQCWVSTEGRFPMKEGYVWEILGFDKLLICVRLWRVDGGVMCRKIRSGAKVRLMSPSHGAASSVWVPRTDLLCGDEWTTTGNMYRVLLGPDVNGHGVVRDIIFIYRQQRVSLFSAEMDVPLLSNVIQHVELFENTSIYTDGSVVQEHHPVINVLIPSPAITRELGHPPLVAGSLIARPDAPAAHNTHVAVRAVNGQGAGCANSFDIEMVMLTFACLIRGQMETRSSIPIWSDCKSAVDKASLMDIHRIRQSGHKEHGLLLRRMYHSRHADSSLLQHVRGHPERRLLKGQKWVELQGCDAGIYLADRLANVQMTMDEKYLWENDGSILAPLIDVTVPDILKMLASIDFWSIVGLDGVPILDSPLTRVQRLRFQRYLEKRDRGKVEQHWSRYIITGPAAAFGEERLYHRRAKVTKVVFNWYLRAEHLDKNPEDQTLEQDEQGKRRLVCHLCGNEMGGDTEKHLYTQCSSPEVANIRGEAEAAVRAQVDESVDPIKSVLQGFQELFLNVGSRHRIWKGIFTGDQARQLSQLVSPDQISCEVGQIISKRLRECMRIGGDALLAIRTAAWKLGGPVQVRVGFKMQQPRVRKGNVITAPVRSIASALGIMTPLDAVKWELERRRRHREKVQRTGLLTVDGEVNDDRQQATETLEGGGFGDDRILDVH